jgi:hypothetical protein
MLPPFWIPWLIIMGITFVVGLCELERPEIAPGQKRTWSTRYTFAVEYSARIALLGIACMWAKAIVWVLS